MLFRSAPPAALPGPEPGQPPHTQGPCRWPHLAPPPQKQPPGSRLSVSQGKEYVREKRPEKVQRGRQSSVPAEQTSLAQRPDRPAPERCRPPPHAEKGACPRPQGRGHRAVPLAPSPWLQGREPARTCCPGVAQGRSSKSPSAFRWQDGNPGFCRLLPIHEAVGGNRLCREPNAGGVDNVCRCRRWGRPGTIPDDWEERQEEGEASPRGASGGGHSESSPASCALGGLGPLRECPCPAGGWTGCRLAGWRQVCPEDRASGELSQHRRRSTAFPCPLARRQSTPDPELRPQPRWSCLMRDRTLPAEGACAPSYPDASAPVSASLLPESEEVTGNSASRWLDTTALSKVPPTKTFSITMHTSLARSKLLRMLPDFRGAEV